MINTTGDKGSGEPVESPLTVSEKAMTCLENLRENDIRIEDPIEKKA